MRKIKNPKAEEYVLLTKFADRNPEDPFLLCYFAYKAVYPNGSISYVGANPEKGIVGYNGEYRHCFRIATDDDISEYIDKLTPGTKCGGNDHIATEE